MYKNSKFTPTREEACNLADNYWSDLSDYSEKFLNNVSSLIADNAKAGKYDIKDYILKTEKEYIKEKLEDVGYDISFIELKDNEKYDIISISFKEK